MSKKRYFLPTLFYIIFFFLFQITGVSITISSGGSGSWSSTSTWVGGVIPTTADSVVINLGHTVGISSSATASALTVNGTLNIGQITIINRSVSGNGSITISGSGALNIGGDNIFSGSFSPGTGSVTYNGSGNQKVMAGNYYILNISGSGTKTILGNSTISNSFNVQSGAAFSLGGVLATLGIGGVATINGVFDYGTSLLKKVSIGGNLGGTGTIDITGGGFAHWLVLSGAYNTIGTFNTAPGSGSRVVYNNAAGAQTIFPSSNYQKLEINTSGPGVANLSGTTTINDSLLIRPGATFAASSLYDIYVNGTWRNDGTFNHGNGTVYFSGTTPQRIDGLVSTNFFNLNINSGAQVNLARSTIVSGSLNNSGNLNVNPSFNLTVLGNFNNNTPTCSFSYSDTVSISSGIYNSGMFTGSPNSTLKMVASSPPFFMGSQTINTFNFFMDNIGNDLTLYTNLRVDGTLELHSNGNIILQGSDLILGPTATVISGPGGFSAARMISTNGVSGPGNLVKEAAASSDFIKNYPIGDSTFFTPVNIAVSNVNISGIGKIVMKPIYYTTPSSAHAKRFLQLSSSNITSVTDFQFMFTFGNSNADYVGVPSTVYRFVGSVPNNVTGASVNLPAYQYGITAPGNTFIDGEWHLELLSSPPTIASFSPNAGCPGDSIDVMGSGFLSVDSVVISSLHATFVIKSDTLLKVVIPSGVSSSIIKVYNPFGSATSTSTLTINPPATANAGTSQTACANNAVVTLNASFGGTATGGTWSGGAGVYTPNNLTANATYSPTPAEITSGSVVLTWTATGGCGSPSGTVIISYTPAPTVNAGTDKTVCANNSVATINGTSANASIYSWTGGGGSYSPTSTSLNITYTPTPSEIASGSVTLTLSGNRTGCNPVQDQMVLFITTAPTANAGGNQTVCANNSTVNLNGTVTVATGGSWSGGMGTFTPSANTLNASYSPSTSEISSGTVNLTLTTTGNGSCMAVTSSKVITITPAPTANAGGNQTVCANNSTVSLNGTVTVATGGYWASSGSGAFVSPSSLSTNYTPSAADISAGSVTLTLTTTGNGSCLPVNSSTVITITPAPVSNAGANQSVCANDSVVSLNGSVTIATGGNWTTSGSGFFTSPSSLTTSYNPSSADIIAGSVTLKLITTGNGSCLTDTSAMLVTITSAPTVSAGANQIVCSGKSANLNGSVTIATGGIWTTSGTGAFLSSSSLNTSYTPSANDISSGSVILTLTTTGNGNCNAVSNQVTLTIVPIPTITAFGSPTTICAGQSASLTATASGGASPFTYSWTPSTSLSSTTVSNPVATPTANITYYVNVTDANGCINSTPAPVTINVNPIVTPSINITVSSGTNPTCSGTAIGFSSSISNGGTTPVYQWMVNGTNVGTNPTFSSSSFLNGDQITCQLTSNANCASPLTVTSSPITITVNSFPSTTISVSPSIDTLCNGVNGAISLLNSETGVTYTAFAGSTSVSSSVTGNGGAISLAIPNSSLSNGSNNIQIKATNSCGVDTLVNSSIIKKSSITAPNISASGVSQLCSAGNSTVTLAVSNSFPKIQWYLGNSLIVGDTNSYYKVVTPGDYRVIVKDSLCSISSSSFTVTSSVAVPVVTLSNGSSYTSATCSGSGSYYQWYANGKAIYGANLSSYNIYYNAQYFVAVNENGCRVVSLPVNVQNPTYDSLAKKNFLCNDSIIYIEAPLEGDEALIYPNPAKDAFKVLYNAKNESEIVVSIYSGEGEKITDKIFAKQSGVVGIDFIGLNLSPGLYKVLIVEGNRKVVKSIQLIN